MKLSQFNSIIPVGDTRYLLYNAYTDKFVSFNRNLYFHIKNKTIVEASEIDTAFYENLFNAGAIIEDTVDEIALIKKMSNDAINNSSEYALIVNPTTNCNFNCWYCYETHNKQAKMTEQTYKNIKSLISNIISERRYLKYFSLSFFGGEPLLYFDKAVKPLMEYVRKESEEHNIAYAFSFTTNGYLINKEMLEWFIQFKEINFQITLDGSKEFHDKVRFPNTKEGSYDKIIYNINSLLSIGHHVTLRINYTADNINSIEAIYEDIKNISKQYRKNLVIDLHRVWQDNNCFCANIDNEIDEIISIFRSKGFYAKQQLPNNLRDPCYADKANGALVNYNGDVFRCTARDFETFPRDGYLNDQGVIIWENDAYNRRINIKFQNGPCLKCRIMPLCGGGCSQKAIDEHNSGNIYCVNGYSEEAKNKIVINRFYNIYMRQQIR